MEWQLIKIMEWQLITSGIVAILLGIFGLVAGWKFWFFPAFILYGKSPFGVFLHKVISMVICAFCGALGGGFGTYELLEYLFK